MTKKRFWLGMLVMVLAFGMMVVGCGDKDSGGGGGGTGNKITITGITGFTGQNMVMVGLMSENGDEIMGLGPLSGSSAIVALLNEDNSPWTGSGSFIIYMMIGTDDESAKNYVYTEGKTLAQLGITNMEDETSMTKLPKLAISGDVTIAFNKFIEVPNN